MAAHRQHLRRLLLAILVSSHLSLRVGGQVAGPAREMTAAGRAAETAELAAAVADIARNDRISRAKKEKQIAEAVRAAIIAATQSKTNAVELLDVALAIAEGAVNAAPPFADTIANAATFTPAVAGLKGGAGQVRSAVYAAAKAPRRPPATWGSPSNLSPAPLLPGGADPFAGHAGAGAIGERGGVSLAETRNGRADAVRASVPAGPKFQWGNAASLALTLGVSARHDDNVFLTPGGSSFGKTGDTMYSIAPGAEFRFGQNSLAHGFITYKAAFNRYAERTGPSVVLNTIAADFGYDSDALHAAANAAYDQTNQNTSFEAARTGNAILRQDVWSIATNVEARIFTRTTVMSGVGFNRNEYKTAALIGSQTVSWPLKLYFETSPKLSISTGTTFSQVKPQNGGPKARDAYYNLGFRGQLSSRLAGEFSVGKRTRATDTAGGDDTIGFEGRFTYDPTAKTNLAFLFNRDFGAGALGESLKSGSYSIRFTGDPSPRWQMSAGITHRVTDYGATVFSSRTVDSSREDSAWEGMLLGSYMINSWISLSADYILRRNSSTFASAQFTNNVFGLSLSLRY